MIQKSFYCAGNWKMHKGPGETSEFFNELAKQTEKADFASLALFLPALTLNLLPAELAKHGLSWGAQNVHWESKGAFTGENSPAVLKEMGATHALVGHSERRTLFFETNSDTQKKMQSLAKAGLTPVLCVGETLAQRKAGQTNQVICEQLSEALQGWNPETLFWLAYEPVWAIGTGEVATPEQAEEAHQALQKQLSTLLPGLASRVPILYGGSVKPDNAESLGAMPHVNGVLVGGASLEVSSLLGILRQGRKGKGIGFEK